MMQDCESRQAVKQSAASRSYYIARRMEEKYAEDISSKQVSVSYDARV